MISIETLENWLTVSTENENLEFKEALRQYKTDDVLKYGVALANEGGGYLVLGVTNTKPRQVTGTQAFASAEELNKLKLRFVSQLHIRVDTHEIIYNDERVLVFEIASRPTGQPLNYKGRYLMRAGESLVAMTPDRLKEIFAEDSEEWFAQTTIEHISSEDVIALLNTQIYFDLLNRPYPSTQSAVLRCLEQEGFIQSMSAHWAITNLGAIVLAKDLNEFPGKISRKAPRFVLYTETGKTNTQVDKKGKFGYAVGFENLVSLVNDTAPHNRIFEETVRIEQRMFPKLALRELIANALIHQDFSVSGASVMIEMYTDRVEISNPGAPIIGVDRFIDSYQSRNDPLADIMRRLGVCEEKGSGVDKVIQEVEVCQLPAPNFRSDQTRTTVTLFAYTDFSDMSKEDRTRACYQHCCLRHVFNKQMTNSSLRTRFGLDDSASSSSSVSQIIAATKAAGLIKPENIESNSTRYARYIPWWG